MDIKATGRFIAKLRHEKELTQSALAERLNISNRTVSKWENGDGLPDTAMLPDLAAALGVTVDELLNGQKNEEARLRVEKVENEKNLLNIFHITFIIALFLCGFGALLGGFTGFYSLVSFPHILFYTHWEIIFTAAAFGAVVLGNLLFYVAAMRLNVLYEKERITSLVYKKGEALAALSYVFFAVFALRVVHRYVGLIYSELIVLALLTALFTCLLIYLHKKNAKQ